MRERGLRAMDTGDWCRLRDKYLSRLREDRRRGLVDPDIVDLLRILNGLTCLVTTSSCSGRIAVFAAPQPGDKRRGGIVVSWHRTVRLEEFSSALEEVAGRYSGVAYMWVSAQPVILTMYAYGETIAREVVSLALRAGLKYTGYRRVDDRIFYIFVLGTERIDIPIMFRGVRLQLRENYSVLVEMLNSYLMLAKAKLERLKRMFSANYSVLYTACRSEGVECAGEEATLF